MPPSLAAVREREVGRIARRSCALSEISSEFTREKAASVRLDALPEPLPSIARAYAPSVPTCDRIHLRPQVRPKDAPPTHPAQLPTTVKRRESLFRVMQSSPHPPLHCTLSKLRRL